MDSTYPGTADFDHALKLMAQSEEVCAVPEVEFAARGESGTAERFRTGSRYGDLLGEGKDFTSEMIDERAVTVWSVPRSGQWFGLC